MVEWERLERQVSRRVADELVPPARFRHAPDVRPLGDVGNDDGALDRRQRGDDVGDLPEAVMRLPAIEVGVRREEDARRDLAEPVEHALHAEVR